MSFGWLGTFRQGSWRSFRSFVLNGRRDVALRVRVINAELNRIGRVRVLYAVDPEDDTKRVETRLGISISEGSALGKLMQAYIAQGGNPFDISHFFVPDTSIVISGERRETYPYGGVVYPKSGVYNIGSVYEGGYLTVLKYIPGRVGGRRDLPDTQVATQGDMARRWMKQEIQMRNDLEARIIKPCDLREQLSLEKAELAQMVGRTLGAVPGPGSGQVR